MASVILCSELGRGSRHLAKLADYAVELEAQNYSVRLVTHDLAAAYEYSEFYDSAFFQAPVFTPPPEDDRKKKPPLLNYSSVLRASGYENVATLAPLLRGWLHILATLKADIVVAEHAPTAVLAAKLLQIPCIMTGNGFSVPPLLTPLKSIVPWRTTEQSELVLEDRMLVKTINDTTTELGFSEVMIENAKDMFSHAAQWIVSVPEMDHYGGRRQPYIVKWTDSTSRAEPKWPKGTGDRIFVYLDASSPYLKPLLSQLNMHNSPTLAIVPGVSNGLIELYHGTHIRLQRDMVDMRQAVDNCKVFINDGDHDITYDLLSLGAPSIFLPTEPANRLLAHRVVANGLGFMGQSTVMALNLEDLLKANSQQHQVWHNAAHISLKYENHQSLERLHDLIKAELVA